MPSSIPRSSWTASLPSVAMTSRPLRILPTRMTGSRATAKLMTTFATTVTMTVTMTVTTTWSWMRGKIMMTTSNAPRTNQNREQSARTRRGPQDGRNMSIPWRRTNPCRLEYVPLRRRLPSSLTSTRTKSHCRFHLGSVSGHHLPRNLPKVQLQLGQKPCNFSIRRLGPSQREGDCHRLSEPACRCV